MINLKISSRIRVVGTIKDIENRLSTPLIASGSLVREEARVLLGVQGESSTPGDSWPAYFSKKLRQWTTASNPPEPPRRQTGELQNSVQRKMVDKTTMRVSATAPYAIDLEYGAKENQFRKRPFMRPAMLSALPKIARFFYRFLSR